MGSHYHHCISALQRVPVIAAIRDSCIMPMFPHKGLGMSSRVCATGHLKDPVPLIEKSRASCPSGRFPPSCIHLVIIITGLNRLYDLCFRPEDGLRCRQGVKPPIKLKHQLFRVPSIAAIQGNCIMQIFSHWIYSRSGRN